MRKHTLFILTAILLVNFNSYSQSEVTDKTQGLIMYEHKINMHRRLTGEQEGMKSMVPEFRTINFQLFFDGPLSLYKPILEDQDEDMGSGGVTMRIQQPYSENYTDASARFRTRMQEFMGKTYLIESELTIQPWKMGDEVKEINGYICRMAYYTDTTTNNEVTAWFTTELPPFRGPENYNTLPGTVLAVDFNNGERVILAKNIAFRELKKNELKRPEKGTKITGEEFQKLVEEQMERMRQNGNGGLIIRN